MNYNINTTISQDPTLNQYIKHSVKAAERTNQLAAVYYDLYQETNEEKYLNLFNNTANCHDFAMFRHYMDHEKTTKVKKLNRCKNPLCIFCSWVDAKKRYNILAGAVELLKTEGYCPKHLVITVPNCSGKELRKQTDNLHKVIARTLRHFKVEGYYRSTEISYNPKTDTYHPHAHILITDYIPVQDLETVAAKAYKSLCPEYDAEYIIAHISSCNYVKELCKYITKPTDYKYDQLRELIVNESIKGLRKYAMAGHIKRAYKRINQVTQIQTAMQKTELEFFGWYDALYNLYNGKQVFRTDIIEK